MHPSVFAALLLLPLLFSCTADRAENGSTPPPAAPETLTLRTEQVRGGGLFGIGAGFISFDGTTGQFPYPVTYPEGVTNVLATRLRVQLYDSLDYIDVLLPKQDEQEVLIIDENDNQNFADDPARPFGIFSFDHDPGIPVAIRRRTADRTVRDTSWIRLGRKNVTDDNVLYSTYQHRQASVDLGERHYRIGITDPYASTTFEYGPAPELAVLAVDGEARNHLEERDHVKRGEYLHLAGQYYRFDSITRDGREVFLTRDDRFAEREGTQVGMLAPEFHLVTTDGDTVRSEELHDKPIVVANSCGCGGDIVSTEAFTEIREAFRNDIHAIRLDSGIKDAPTGWNADVEAPYNEDIYRDYRGAYCSRMAYLVGKDRRILDQFTITDWEESLPERLGRP